MGGEFDRLSRFHVTSRADSTRGDKSDEDKPSCIQSERYPIRGGLAEKQRLAQALFCI